MRIDRAREEGAVVMVVAVFVWILVIAVIALSFEAQVSTGFEHTWSAAQAVAHDVAVEANYGVDRERLSIEALSGRFCEFGSGIDGAPQADADLCNAIVKQASEVAGDNGVRIVALVVGPKLEKNEVMRPGYLTVLVAVKGNPVLAAVNCSDTDPNRGPWCPPLVWAAAEISG